MGDMMSDRISANDLCQQLQDYLKLFTPLDDEGIINFNMKAISSCIYDDSHVVMCNATLSFPAYSGTISGERICNINIKDLHKYAKLMPGDGPDTLSFGNGKIFLKSGQREREFPLIESGSPPTPPNVEYVNMVKLKGEHLIAEIKILKTISDVVSVSLEKHFIEFFAKNEEGDTYSMTYSEEDTTELDAEDEEEVLVNIEYLSCIAGNIPKDKDVTLKVRSEYPLSVSWKDGLIDVTYLIAPRVIP